MRNSGLKWTLLDIQTFTFPGKGPPDFVIQVGINGCHTVILIPPSCSNVVPPFHNFQLLKCCPSFPQSYQSPHTCSNKNIEVKCVISARDDNHAYI